MRQRDKHGVIPLTLASRRPPLRHHDVLPTVNANDDRDLLALPASTSTEGH
jgi:hypothetical protein